MDKMLSKKINLLVHLARIDGRFHDAEKDLLKSILTENGLHESFLHEHQGELINLDELSSLPGKSELLFWILKLIHADQYLHPKEVAAAKAFARQLHFKEDVIDHFSATSITTLAAFEAEAKKFQLQVIL